MTVKISTGLAEYLAGTGSLRAAFHGTSRISLYAGAEVANADAAASGATLLCTILSSASPLEFEAAVTGGIVTKATAQTWSGTNAASGTATWFRVEITTDDRSTSTSALRLQGSIGTVVGDMVMTNPVLVSGNTKAIENFRMAVPLA